MDIASHVFDRGRLGLQHLFDAYEYSRQLGRSCWDFAVEIDILREHGLTSSDCRWLLCKGYVEQGRETTRFGEENRTFRRESGLHFGKKTCFVLTPQGASLAERCFKGIKQGDRVPFVPAQSAVSEQTNGVVKPTWDRDCQELRLGKTIVKRFKVPAPNQEIILAAFQEEGWPVYIHDPLPPHSDMDPKRRLHDTINSLNRSQKNHLIHFRGNGSGQGVRWELVQDSEQDDRSSPLVQHSGGNGRH